MEFLPAAYERLCMHEFVLSGEPMRRELHVKTLDLAKRLLDHGVHPPTVYFPLIGEEALLLATKSQDSASALKALRVAAPAATAVVCVQNGVENERVALRLLPSVYGAVVMASTAHLEPGVVQSYGTRGVGVIDLGRYPAGTDQLSQELAGALERSGFSSRPRPDIMRFKYAKLIANLQNAVDAICQAGPGAAELIGSAREEGRAALTAAGVDFV